MIITAMAQDLSTMEKTMKALANRRRLGILRYLRGRKEANVSEIAEAIRLSFKATSKHLNQLAGVGLLSRDQKSLLMFYRLSAQMPSFVRDMLRELA